MSNSEIWRIELRSLIQEAKNRGAGVADIAEHFVDILQEQFPEAEIDFGVTEIECDSEEVPGSGDDPDHVRDMIVDREMGL